MSVGESTSPEIRRIACALAVALGLLGLAGCGTIMGYCDPQPVEVVTQPSGASITLNDAPQGATTPCVLNLDPEQNHVLVARANGPRGELRGQTTVTRSLRTGVIVLDAVLTLGIGLLVDWGTGGLYEFDRPRVALTLTPEADAPTPPRPQRVELCTCGEVRVPGGPCPFCKDKAPEKKEPEPKEPDER